MLFITLFDVLLRVRQNEQYQEANANLIRLSYRLSNKMHLKFQNTAGSKFGNLDNLLDSRLLSWSADLMISGMNIKCLCTPILVYKIRFLLCLLTSFVLYPQSVNFFIGIHRKILHRVLDSLHKIFIFYEHNILGFECFLLVSLQGLVWSGFSLHSIRRTLVGCGS